MFRNTNDAIDYGLTASAEDRKRLAGLRYEFIRQGRRAFNRNQFDLGIMFSTQAQFCREALHAEFFNAKIDKILQVLGIKNGATTDMAAEAGS
jgi:hypothetical protein